MAELCRREGIAERLYYSGSKAFLEAGKRRLAGDTARAATSSEVTDPRRAARQLKEVVAAQALELRLLKYDRYQGGGYEALKDRPPRPKQVCNRIPDDIRGRVLRLALQAPELSPRERAMRCIDTEGYFVSEASVYRLLKAHDLITRPACVVLKAADAFKDKTVRPNQLWQTDFTDLKVIGWGWFYLSTLLDDFSRSIIAWTRCTTMRTEDVTDTLELALEASDCNQAKGVHKPRLLSDNGSSSIAGDLAEWLDDQNMEHARGAPYPPHTQGQIERWHQTLKNRTWLENYYLPDDLQAQLGAFVEQPPARPRAE